MDTHFSAGMSATRNCGPNLWRWLLLATGDKVAVRGFVLADLLTRQQQRWSDISPGTQAQASGSGTCDSVRPTTVPSSRKASRGPCPVLHPVPVAQVPLLHHHLPLVQSESPLWPPSPAWMSPPVEALSYRESVTRALVGADGPRAAPAGGSLHSGGGGRKKNMKLKKISDKAEYFNKYKREKGRKKQTKKKQPSCI